MRISVALLGLALGGCAVSHYTYNPPAVPVPTAYKNTAPVDSLGRGRAEVPAPVAADTARPRQLAQAPALPAWWAIFNDTTLTRLETQAASLNFTTRAAVVRIDQARAQLRVAEALRAPVVALAPSVYNTQLSALRPVQSSVIPAVAVQQNQFYVPLNVNYEVDLWGRLRRGAQAARATEQASEADEQAVRLSVSGDVGNAYFSLRGLDAELLVLDSARQARRYNVQLTNARFQAGVDNEIGVRRAQTELATVEASAIELRRQRAGLVASLATLTGKPASSFVLPSLAPDSVSYQSALPLADHAPAPASAVPPLLVPLPSIPATLPASLLARRPDLRRQERLLSAADLRADQARLNRLPTLLLNGFIGPQAKSLGELPKVGNALTYYVGGGVNIPLFDGGRLRGAEQLARAQGREQEANYQGAALTAYQEVETALANVRAAEAQLAAQQRALTAARLAGRLTLERYRRGLSDYFAVVDADRQTLDAARLVVQTQTTQLRAAVALVRALGGGWQQ
ncbi:efflux transporter outer membrane subunit [Hymenobacter ginsengisoli]|uniref:Efflux transporter outer membrane subunit n=1 Tax=Hymenobacter ginsengisoli TaxID=1051626 RepID=A0ABP8QJE3_9BACT|nr:MULTISPECIES: efflux transporter outer membrane subunit [unclassified Hymenobacter]MBO2033324.1 efflux transporter outer membrane subunit [Hymenobacter sp. BT559]